MMTYLLELDSYITKFISQLFPHNSFFDAFFSFLSLEGNYIFIWLIIMGVLFIIEEKKDRIFIIYFAISLLVTSVLVNNILKPVFRRDRPYVANRLESKFCPKDFSFPSGHASGAFAGAVVLATFDKKRRFYYYGVALLVSLSRIYLQCHYLLDVTFGAIIGYLVSMLTLQLGSYSKKLYKSQKS